MLFKNNLLISKSRIKRKPKILTHIKLKLINEKNSIFATCNSSTSYVL